MKNGATPFLHEYHSLISTNAMPEPSDAVMKQGVLELTLEATTSLPEAMAFLGRCTGYDEKPRPSRPAAKAIPSSFASPSCIIGLFRCAAARKSSKSFAACFRRPTSSPLSAIRDRISDFLKTRNIRTSFLQKIPGAKRHYTKMLPLMPFALEQFDLQDYDLVLSSESGPAKGVITRADALHVCYCHSPMRYIWDQFHVYRLAFRGWVGH